LRQGRLIGTIVCAVVFFAFLGAPAAQATQVTGTYIVTLDAPPTAEDLEVLAGVATSVHGFEHLAAAVVVAAPAHKALLGNLPGVRGVYENETYDLLLRQSTRTIGADAVWDLGVDGAGVGVAVIDAGVDGLHPDLCGAPEVCEGTDTKTVQNVKFLGRQDVADPVVAIEDLITTDTGSGHGSHVAGIIGGFGLKSTEPFKYRGVAPGADIVGLGVGDVVEAVNVLAAYDWAIERQDQYNIRVINNSWGPGKGTPYDPEHPVNLATDAAWDAGISVVFGSGNDGPSTDSLNMFSAHPRAVSAAGGAKDGNVAFFSSRGVPGSDLWRPTVTAPGYNIASVRATTGFYTWGADALAPNPDMIMPPDNAWYATASGTSMAAPHVSGTIALMQQAAHDARGTWLTAEQVMNIIQNTAVTQDPARGKGGLPNYQAYTMGAGYLDAEAAVQAAAAGTGMEAYDDGVDYATKTFAGQIGPAAVVPVTTFETTFTVAEGAISLDVMADWSVAANDVDIDLYRPNGTLARSTFLQCAPDAEPNGYSSFCTSIPNERITVAAPAAGTWRAVVKGSFSVVQDVTGVWSAAYPSGSAPAPLSAATVTVTAATPASVAGQGNELVATVRDAAGRPLPNAPVTWSSAGVGSVGHAETLTHLNGTARAVATSDLAGDQIATATSGQASGSVAITWLGLPDGGGDPDPPASTPGRASGGGWISDSGKHTFGFWAEYRDEAEGPAGELSFNGHDGTHVTMDGVTSFVRTENQSTVTGTASVDGVGGYRVVIELADNGEPGKDADSFHMTVTNPADSSYRYEKQGILGGGNLQVEQ